jgi:hypothetical protein
MSDERRHNLFARGEEFLTLFRRGAEFTKELLRENERLRHQLVEHEQEQQSAARNPEDWDKLRMELKQRLRSLEESARAIASACSRWRTRTGSLSSATSRSKRRQQPRQSYVASYQLHSTRSTSTSARNHHRDRDQPDRGRGLRRLPVRRQLQIWVAAAEGLPPSAFPKCALGSGPLGKAVASTETTCWDTARSDDLRQPIVCIPLAIQKRPIGAIAIYSLLQQKSGFTALDHELFTLLGGHAATAIFAARLYSQSERKLNTIQGFIDLLTK